MPNANMNPEVAGPAAAAAHDPIFENIRNRLANTFQGTQNVPTLYHNIDILTNNEIIVIKRMTDWAEGIGLLQVHNTQFPNKQKHLHLYETNLNNRANQDLLNKIMSICIQIQVSLTVEQ